MINAISLKNFQAHKDTNIVFDPHITAIVGSSDSGKTSVLRALYWVLQNKPNGTQMVSFWNRKKDGTPKQNTSVEISMDDHIITRIRNTERNGYDMDEKELSAIGRDVPEQITQFFNLSDINIAKQFDQHFLLSESAGEVARRLNEMVKLNIIDEVSSTIEQMKRANKKELDKALSDKELLEKDINKYNWIDAATNLLIHLKKLENKNKEVDNSIISLQSYISTLREQDSIVISYKKIKSKIANRITTIDTYISENKDMEVLIESLNSCITELSKNTSIMESFKKIRKARRIIEELEELREDKKTVVKQLNSIATKIESYTDYISNIMTCNEQMQSLKQQLPDTCPLCGKPVDKEIL